MGERLVYRGEETAFELVEAGRAYAFDADAKPCARFVTWQEIAYSRHVRQQYPDAKTGRPKPKPGGRDADANVGGDARGPARRADDSETGISNPGAAPIFYFARGSFA